MEQSCNTVPGGIGSMPPPPACEINHEKDDHRMRPSACISCSLSKINFWIIKLKLQTHDTFGFSTLPTGILSKVNTKF